MKHKKDDMSSFTRRCVYCRNVITEDSEEHIIPNALGGKFKSVNICCNSCNQSIGAIFDSKFTSIFNCFTSNIENIVKDNNSNSLPLYTGVVECNGKKYDVSMKDRKVVSYTNISRDLKCDASKLDVKVLGFKFNYNNEFLFKGMSKIAFNFAIESGIPFEKLSHGLNLKINNGILTQIDYNYKVLPFIPLCMFDSYLELETDLILYHNLSLFSQVNKLWCYVDLFNTFQCYVLLSDDWDVNNNVSASYCQLVEKIDRTIPNIRICRPKHLLNYSLLYDVPYTSSIADLKKEITDKVLKDPYIKDLNHIIGLKYSFPCYLGKDFLKVTTKERLKRKHFLKLRDLTLYTNYDDSFNTFTFRRLLYYNGLNEITSYPSLIEHFNSIGITDNYLRMKVDKLVKYLFSNDFILIEDGGVSK